MTKGDAMAIAPPEGRGHRPTPPEFAPGRAIARPRG